MSGKVFLQEKLTGQPGQLIGINSSGEAAAVDRPNPNLLDNWYFPEIVNQRGEESYSGNGYGYDRWKTENAAVSVSGGVMTMQSTGSVNWGGVHQYFENPGKYAGKTLTASILYRTASSTMSLAVYHTGGSWKSGATLLPASDWALREIHCTVTSAQDLWRLSVQNSQATTETIEIKGIKLELGEQQTLARKDGNGNWVLLDSPPDPTLELLKCQRYLYVMEGNDSLYTPNFAGLFTDSGTICAFGVPLPAKMRASPATSMANGTRFLINGVNGGVPGYTWDSPGALANNTAHLSGDGNAVQVRLLCPTTITSDMCPLETPLVVRLYSGKIIISAEL